MRGSLLMSNCDERIHLGTIALALSVLGGCADGYGDRFEARIQGAKVGGTNGGARGSGAEEVEDEGGPYSLLAITDATYWGELGPIGEISVDAPTISYSNGPGSTSITLTDAPVDPRSMLIVSLPFDLLTVAPGSYRDIGNIIGCSGFGQGFDWDDAAPPLEIEIEEDPEEPSLLRLDYVVDLADGSWAEGTLWAERR